MRKLLLATFTSMSLIASAQWGHLDMPADELAGTPARTFYVYKDSTMRFMFNTEMEVVLFSERNIFNVKDNRELVLVGLYDKDDKLIKKYDLWFDAISNDYRVLRLPRTKKNKPIIKEIIDHLALSGNHVRFLASLYSGNFDIKVPSDKHLPTFCFPK